MIDLNTPPLEQEYPGSIVHEPPVESGHSTFTIDHSQIKMHDSRVASRNYPFFATVKQYSLTKKLQILLNYFVGPVLFIWLTYSIYDHIQRQNDVQQSWQHIRSAFSGPHLLALSSVVLLMAVNWGIEARKWQLLAGTIQKISYARALKAVCSGQAFGFNTPNRIGEPAGRALFLNEGNRLRGVILSMVGSMSQTITGFVMGLAALLYLRWGPLDKGRIMQGIPMFWLDWLICAAVIGSAVLILFYFRLSWTVKLVEKIPFIAKHRFFVQNLENTHWKELTRILFLSVCRFVVFVVQYVLLFRVFEVEMHWLDAATMVCVMFLLLAIIPTITLAELGFRGKISLQLFGALSSNSIGIIATAAGIWIINLIIPAIAGSLFILGLRLFRNKST